MMKEKRNIKYKFILCKIYLILLVALIASACVNQEEVSEPYRGPSLKVTAKRSDTAFSRGYIDSGPVEEGTYCLSFPGTDNKYVLADVNFGIDTAIPSIGIVSIPGENQELIWEKIGPGTTLNFYLDNVPLEKSSSDPLIVTFEDEYNPYKADEFDSVNGTNDLLWGTVSTPRNVSTLNFDLHHYMARLKVEITVNNENSPDETSLDLSDATVTISNLILAPESYNREDGSLYLGETPVYETFYLVAEEGYKWSSDIVDEENENIKYYTTLDFVFPPQNLLEDSQRPRLTISLKNGKEFSGVIPYAMTVIDSTYPAPGYPMALSLLKEHILTIRTMVTEEPPELSFMPVYVVEWVDKGNFSFDAHQAGIYTASEFYQLITYYNSDDETTRNYQLQRYGNYSLTGWNFVLWNSINLEYNNIYDKMKPGGQKPQFTFSFSGYGVYITFNEITKQVNEEQLKGIVNGTKSWDDIQ